MSSFCVICSDKFRDSDHVVATTCGHIYHFSCITRWFGQNRTCPECRSVLREKKLLRLYFNLQNDDSVILNCDNEISTLRDTCAKKDVAIDSLNEQIKSIREYFNTTEEKYAKELSKYQEKTERLERSLRHFSSVEKKVIKLEQENRQLKNNLEGLKDVQTLVSGCQKDVQDMVDKCVQEQDLRQLATVCVMIKREMSKAQELKSKLRDEVARLTKEKGIYSHDLQQANKRIHNLAQQLQNMEDDILNVKRKRKDNTTAQSPSSDLDMTPEVIFCSRTNVSKSGMSNNNNFEVKPSTSKGSPVHCKAGMSKSHKHLDITPISMPSTKIEKKVVPRIVTKVVTFGSGSLSCDNGSSMLKIYSSSNSSTLKKDENSAIQIGYNGFGGHSKTILPFARNKRK